VRTLAACERLLAPFEYAALLKQIEAARAQLRKRTAWRIEGTLREFERFAPVNVWFDYPVHVADRAGVLGDVRPEEPKSEWRARGRQKLADNNQNQRDNVATNIGNQIDFAPAESVAIQDLTLTNKNGKPYTAKEIGEWFGNGKKARPELIRRFEKFIGEDGRSYLRRKDDDTEDDD
jgi:hypothetical protein